MGSPFKILWEAIFLRPLRDQFTKLVHKAPVETIFIVRQISGLLGGFFIDLCEQPGYEVSEVFWILETS